VLYPAFGYPKPRGTHPRQGVIVCDGVGTHLCEDVLDKAIDLGMEIVLRVPNLSYIFQGEDNINLKELKAEWRIQKFKPSNKFNKERKTALLATKPLSFETLMLCVKPAWDKAFGCSKRNRRGWELEGTIPCNRYAMWRKRGIHAPKRISDPRSVSWRGSPATKRNLKVALAPLLLPPMLPAMLHKFYPQGSFLLFQRFSQRLSPSSAQFLGLFKRRLNSCGK